MSTIREQIIEAAVALVNTGAPSGVPTCVRTLMQPSEQAQLPTMTCFPVRETVDNSSSSGRWGPVVTRTLMLRFVIYNQGTLEDPANSIAAVPADQSLDDIVSWLVKSLAGQQLGGLANNIAESELNWTFDEGNFLAAGISVDFRVEYQTLRTDPNATH